ncbi:MAG: GNAT family N-acetyltransferase, partial [Cytophagaceae bacterium]
RIHILNQPFLSQQLGGFSAGEQLIDYKTVFQLLSSRYKQIYYQLNKHNLLPVKELFSNKVGFNLKIRNNYALNLNSYEDLKKNYSQSHKRNINKSLKTGVQVAPENPATLLNLFKQNQKQRIKDVKEYHLSVVKSIFLEAEKQKKLLVLIARLDHNAVAGIAVIKEYDRMYYLLGASTPEARNHGAMHLVFDHLIRSHSNQNLCLDFEGSDAEGIARFFKGFGAECVEYPCISRNNLPLHLSYLIKLKKWLYSLKRTV